MAPWFVTRTSPLSDPKLGASTASVHTPFAFEAYGEVTKVLVSIVHATASPLTVSTPTARNCPPNEPKVEGKIRPPRRLSAQLLFCVADPPAAGTPQISPALASVTKKP